MIEVYTDGAYNAVRQQGGWGSVVVVNGVESTFADSVKPATGNRMEITAALEGLLHTPPNSELIIYIDSQYVFGTMTQGWRRRANGDLWVKLDEANSQRKVTWRWISGDSTNKYHQMAHKLANGQAAIEESTPHTAAPAPEPTASLTHIDENSRPKMVDVGAKPDTDREAAARCTIKMKPETFALIQGGKVAKGDVLTTAQLAGIMAAKQTPHLIPLCHPLLITEARVEFIPDEAASRIEITSTVRCTGKTGVEMEALTAAAVAALTIYDMCKAVDRAMVISELRLLRKSGGKSGTIQLDSWD
jgi:cyclic pyranopterin phosphate synthase